MPAPTPPPASCRTGTYNQKKGPASDGEARIHGADRLAAVLPRITQKPVIEALNDYRPL